MTLDFTTPEVLRDSAGTTYSAGVTLEVSADETYTGKLEEWTASAETLKLDTSQVYYSEHVYLDWSAINTMTIL